MDSIEIENAEKEFKELLSAYWAAQLAQLRVAQPNSGDSQPALDSHKTEGPKEDAT
jgi:hypothetical protein